MISDELQYRIHLGDRDAFCQLFSCYGREVYLSALKSLGDASAARNAAKQVFFRLQRELRAATGPIDVQTRIDLLTQAEIANVAADQHATAQPLQSWDATNAAQSAAPQCNHTPNANDAAGYCTPEPFDNQPPASAMDLPDAPIPLVEQKQPDLQSDAAAQAELPPDTPHIERPPEQEATSAPQQPCPPGSAHPSFDGSTAPASQPCPPERAHPLPQGAPPMPNDHKRHHRRMTLLWILVILLGLVLLWLILGVLMDIRLLAPIDLGYIWFNEHVYRLFRLPWNGA